MTEKTTEEVVLNESQDGQKTAKKPRRKPTARKTVASKKKAAENVEAVEKLADASITEHATDVPAETPAKKTTRRGRKPKTPQATAPEAAPSSPVQQSSVEPVSDEKQEEQATDPSAQPQQEAPAIEQSKEEQPQERSSHDRKEQPNRQEQPPKPIPPFNPVRIDTIVDMVNAPKGQLLLNDQQIQQLTLDEALRRFRWIEGTLAWVFNYDVVITDTNIWLELLVGKSSSHSDPKVNARLMFERQLEFISKLVRYRGGRFMMMSESYEEIDRFASLQAPTNYKDADFTDEALCRNVAARLAKRLILSQQRENRLKIEGICAESHHAAFADPAIIRKTVELFADGKRVLLITNDASVAIRSMGMCDDLQRINGVDDETWEEVYTPLRPMVVTMDDLKVVDNYTRQYHFLQMAAGKQWMEDVPQRMEKRNIEPLMLWMDGFRPGDKHPEVSKQQKQQQAQQQKQMEQARKQQEQAKKQQEVQKQQQEQKKQQQKQNQQRQQKRQQMQQQAQQPNANVDEQPSPEESPVEQLDATAENIVTENANQQGGEVVIVQDIPNDSSVNEQQTEAPAQKRPQRRRPQRRRPRTQNGEGE